MYQQAPVPGRSKEDSTVEAEKLFFELSLKGHSKAMHNYAVLQQKKGDYKLAEEWFVKAGLDASLRNIKKMKEFGQLKEDLYLVVASRRSPMGDYGPIMRAFHGTEAMDMTHLRSFGGKAKTCDISPWAISGAKHITANVLTFDFSKKYNLKHVLIERLPTINSVKLGLGQGPLLVEENNVSGIEDEAKVNYVGSVILNLSQAMERGAILEIEWDPYSTQAQFSREKCEE